MNKAQQSAASDEVLDALIIGAGFSGLYQLYRLRQRGFSVRLFEAGADLGGIWHWNCYPGARVDSHVPNYEYSMEELWRDWNWTERFPAWDELRRYFHYVDGKLDLSRDIRFDTRVTHATFDADSNLWRIVSADGHSVWARFFITCTGFAAKAYVPDFPGIDDFKGPCYHTGHWPHDGVDFTGKRVGLIGTGSSGVQTIPIIAREAADLTVFQRTATYTVPAHNILLDSEFQRDVKARYAEFRDANRQAHLGFGSDYPASDELAAEATPEERAARYEERWERGGLHFMGAFLDLMLDPDVNDGAAEFVRGKIRGLVDDPTVADLLAPDQVLGCKRLCVDTGYYETFNRANVHLVDVGKTPIEFFTEVGVQVAGREYEFDIVVFATGFDAMTGALHRMDIRGLGGQTLKEKWAAGPRTYLGLGTTGFPNLFIITGPGSPSVLANMVPAIEQHVDWIGDCLAHLQSKNLKRIEAEQGAEDDWVDHVNEVAGFTLYPTCNSWYLGANIPDKTRIFIPYIGCDVLDNPYHTVVYWKPRDCQGYTRVWGRC